MDLYNKIEKLRSEKQSWTIVAAFTSIFMVFTFVRMTLFSLIFLVVVLISFSKVKDCNKKIQKVYKNEFLYGILNQYFDNVIFNWEGGFLPDEIKKMGLNRMGNRFFSEDYISAVYNGVAFQQAEVKIQNVTGTGENRSVQTYFKGRVFVFEYGMKDVISTMVFSKNYMYEGRGIGLKYNKVEMESVGFNQRFVVKSARDIDAFFVLTPQIMECINILKNKYGNVAFHFTPLRVYVAYNTTENAFDLDTRKKLDLGLERERREKDIAVIIDLINALQISNNRDGEQIS